MSPSACLWAYHRGRSECQASNPAGAGLCLPCLRPGLRWICFGSCRPVCDTGGSRCMAHSTPAQLSDGMTELGSATIPGLRQSGTRCAQWQARWSHSSSDRPGVSGHTRRRPCQRVHVAQWLPPACHLVTMSIHVSCLREGALFCAIAVRPVADCSLHMTWLCASFVFHPPCRILAGGFEINWESSKGVRPLVRGRPKVKGSRVASSRGCMSLSTNPTMPLEPGRTLHGHG